MKTHKTYLVKFLIWRSRHINNSKFMLILSLLAGFFAGIGAVVLKNFTYLIELFLNSSLIKSYHIGLYFIFPLIGISLVWLIMTFILKRKVSHGIPSTLHAISKKKGIIDRHQMIGSILTAPLTVGFGGSVGLEGPTVATGAAISSNLARLFHLNQSQRTLLIACAASGALSAIFKAPIAAIIFAIEVFSLDLTLISLIPLLIASLSAIFTSYMFFGSEILIPVRIEDKFELGQFPFYIFLGIIAAFIALYFAKVYDYTQNKFDAFKSPLKKLLTGGLLLGGLIFLVPPLYGEGFDVINNIIRGVPKNIFKTNPMNFNIDNHWIMLLLLLGLILFKIIGAALTFGSGGVGGIFAPTLFMGSIMGYCTARLINHLNIFNVELSTTSFALVGMAGLMAGVLHAPLTAIFLIAELTGGYELFVPLMLTAGVSFSVTKYFLPHSVYAMELGRKGDLITHDKDHAVLSLMDINKVVENKFCTLSPTMNLGEVIQNAVIKSQRNIYPVVQPEDNKFLGIILLDDIRTIMFDSSLHEKILVKDLMHQAPEIIYLNSDKMTVIMKKFENSGAWNLPVVDKEGYRGFISKSKLLTVYRRKLIEVTPKI